MYPVAGNWWFFTIIARNQYALKQLFYIKNTDAGEIVQPVLSLEIGKSHFSFAITDKSGDELYTLAYYSAGETDSEELAGVFAEHPELNRTFYSVQVCYDYSKHALVPNRHFSDSDSTAILDTMHGKNGQSAIFSEPVHEWQLYNVYAVPQNVQGWISKKFPAAVYRHHFTLGMKTMPYGPSDRLLVNIHTDEFSYVAIKDYKLLIAQTHSYASPEDICYYLLKTCHEFSLSQEEVQLTVTGLIEKDSQLYREMYQFFVNVEFREPGWHLPAAGYPAHYFTTLNDIARCAS